MKHTQRLRELLAADTIIVAPGAYDALSACLVQEAGFEVIYATGAGIANSQFCFSDVGLTTLSEVLEQVRRILNAVERPVIADIDTGYGNFLNVIRTVKAFEQAGVAGLQIEDQLFPKKCGHFEGKQVVETREMVSKIKAAVDARTDQDLVIIARTDARAIFGIQEALERAHAYREAGADGLFVEAPQTRDELETIAREIPVPTVANMVEGGKTPLCSAQELQEMGYSMVLFANATLRTAIKASQRLLNHLRSQGSTKELLNDMITMEERNRITGLAEVYALEKRYL